MLCYIIILYYYVIVIYSGIVACACPVDGCRLAPSPIRIQWAAHFRFCVGCNRQPYINDFPRPRGLVSLFVSVGSLAFIVVILRNFCITRHELCCSQLYSYSCCVAEEWSKCVYLFGSASVTPSCAMLLPCCAMPHHATLRNAASRCATQRHAVPPGCHPSCAEWALAHGKFSSQPGPLGKKSNITPSVSEFRSSPLSLYPQQM